MSRVGIIGAGSWGTALSLVLANNGHSVEIWSIVESEIEMLKEKHEHIDKLPGVKLPDSITFTTDIEETIKNNDILVLAVPSVFTRSTAVKMAPFVKEGQIIVCVAKGIEENTLMTISDVVESEIPCGACNNNPAGQYSNGSGQRCFVLLDACGILRDSGRISAYETQECLQEA